MKYKLEINLDNDAFKPCPNRELQRILREIADILGERHLDDRNILDSNGNTVGKVQVVESKGRKR